MTSVEYFKAKLRREEVKAELRKLNKLIDTANLAHHYEPLSYAQFSKAVEYWYNANNQSTTAYEALSRAGKIAWAHWTERYEKFIATGSSGHIYTDCIMCGMSYEDAYIKDWNEGPIHHKGGFPIHRSPITHVNLNSL